MMRLKERIVVVVPLLVFLRSTSAPFSIRMKSCSCNKRFQAPLKLPFFFASPAF